MPTTSDQQSNTAAPIRFIVDEPGIDTEFGIKGRGYSPDNGQHFFVQNTTKGRIFRLLDAQRLYPLLKPMFDQVYGGPVETSLHWVDILDKPDLVLKSDLPDLSIYALKKDVPSVDGFLKLSDLAGYARLSDIPSLDGYVKTSDLPDMTAYYTKTDTDSKLSSKADVSSLNAVKSTAESASSTASSAQEASQEAQSTASLQVLQTQRRAPTYWPAQLTARSHSWKVGLIRSVRLIHQINIAINYLLSIQRVFFMRSVDCNK